MTYRPSVRCSCFPDRQRLAGYHDQVRTHSYTSTTPVVVSNWSTMRNKLVFQLSFCTSESVVLRTFRNIRQLLRICLRYKRHRLYIDCKRLKFICWKKDYFSLLRAFAPFSFYLHVSFILFLNFKAYLTRFG